MTVQDRPRPGYFDMAYYAWARDLVAGWRALGEIPGNRLPASDDRAACERLLHAEARLLDHGRLDAWLALFTEDCGYWLPTDVTGEDPARFVTWEFNDRRRLEERVERLATNRAFSQLPATRTSHLYGNIELLTAGPDEIHALCAVHIQTNLCGRASMRAGWNGFVLARKGDAWRIRLKRIGLYDADLPQDNNSFTL